MPALCNDCRIASRTSRSTSRSARTATARGGAPTASRASSTRVEGGDEVAHLSIGNPEGVGQVEKSRVGDAPIQFGEEALLPRRRVIDHGDGVDAELQG